MELSSFFLWLPLGGAIVSALIPSQHATVIRTLGNLIALLVLVLALYLATLFDGSSSAIQLTAHFALGAPLGIPFLLGIDGISLPLILLASLLMWIALQASGSITTNIKAYYVCMLLLEFGILGVFLTQDWALFYICWEATLIPLFFLLDRWGNKRRHAASLNFALYTFSGSIFILAALFALAKSAPATDITLMSNLAEAAQKLPKDKQLLVLIAFLLGFGIKMPIFPLHGWLPLAHTEAPFPVSVLISGIVLKMGAYGLLRVALILPQAMLSLEPVLAVLALFSMLYGGLLAWRQSDLRAMLAYASISHMGIILLGISTLNLSGMMGSLLHMSAHGLVIAALFLLSGMLNLRTSTLNIQDYSSLATVTPRFAVLMSISLLGLMALPGTISFMASLQVIIGGFQRWGAWMICYSFSILLGATYAMRTIGLLFTGPTKPHMQHLDDLKSTEVILGLILVSLIVIFGFMPNLIMDLSTATMQQALNGIASQLSGNK